MTTKQKDFLRVLAFVYIRNMKYEKALVLLKAMRELMPEDAYTLRSLAYVYYLMNQPEEALETIDSAFDPMKDAEMLSSFHLLKAKILWALDEQQPARESLDLFLKEIA
tara:strand:+ start:18636 stop:18962 length:327 start_codon:yes stop_codon:yes gene_type:complete